MSVITKTGDTGLTSVLGGPRISKASARPEAIGTVDELSSWLGLIIVGIQVPHQESLVAVQNDCFRIGAELAAVQGTSLSIMLIGPGDVARIETLCRRLENEMVPLKGLVLPGGGNRMAAQADIARSICRRAERRVVALLEKEPTPDGDISIVTYLNRLSDYLFLLARTLDSERRYASQ